MQSQTRVIVFDTAVTTKGGTSARTGKPWTIREQIASLDGPRFRVPVRLTLGDQQAAYEPGVYEIDFDKSIAVGRYDDIGFERSLQLVRVGDLPKAKAA